jgi:hypothetical protein
MKRFALIAVLLAGCSGMSYALDNYSGVPVQRFSYMGQEFRVFDKPVEGRLMITPTAGEAYIGGATFGAVSTPETVYLQAANAFLAPRNCKGSTIALVVKPQYETFYNCG